MIRVERAWDVKEGAIEPKSRAGRRSVPIPAVPRDFLDEHKLRSGYATRPFNHSSVVRRAEVAWRRGSEERALREEPELEPIGLHESRHTFASLMIAAGVGAKALSTYMGHSSITITLDRYGHLFPGNENEAAALLDAYLQRSATAARLADPAMT